MTALLALGLTLAAAYLIGSLPFGYLVARSRGVDIFRQGSGNIGATNIGRVLGRRFGIIVFVLDFAKGAVPVVGARLLAGPSATELPPDSLAVAAGLAAFLGHLFPLYLGFRGGKGVATGAGGVTVLLPGPTLGAALVWLAVLCATRYVSLSSLAAVTALCALRVAATASIGPFAPDQLILTLFCFLAAGLVFVRHHANLGRLLRGTENRLRETPAMLLLTKIIHVLALGLWFGSSVFFVLTTLSIFGVFQSLGDQPPDQRPAWLPIASDFDHDKGTRLAGFAINPLFPQYFALTGACGLLATATAFSWFRIQDHGTAHQLRCLFVGLALVTVLAGWPVADHVAKLRLDRYSADPLTAGPARAAFGTWHTVSLLLNFGTILLVTAAMVLAAWLPTPPRPTSPPMDTEATRSGVPAQPTVPEMHQS